MMDLEDNEGEGGESSEEETASLLAWMSAKKEAMLEEEEEDDSVPRQLPPKLSPMRKRGEVLTPPSRLLGEETRYSSSEEEEEEELTFTTKMDDDANKIDEEYFASATTNKNTSGVSAEATTKTVNKRLDGMTLNREEEEKYMRRNPRPGVVSSSAAASSPWEEKYGKPMILPEAKPIGSYPMTDLERRTLELRADPAAKDDLERAIHLAMERATIPINGSVGKTVVSKDVGKEEEEEEEEELKRAAAHSRKLALQNRDFRSVENVAEIREGAARVKTWFRASASSSTKTCWYPSEMTTKTRRTRLLER